MLAAAKRDAKVRLVSACATSTNPATFAWIHVCRRNMRVRLWARPHLRIPRALAGRKRGGLRQIGSALAKTAPLSTLTVMRQGAMDPSDKA